MDVNILVQILMDHSFVLAMLVIAWQLISENAMVSVYT